MKYYWTTKEGTKIDVDNMSTEHLRNALKMILRNMHNAKSKPKRSRPNFPNFNPLGNIEACFQEEQYKEWEEEHYELVQADSFINLEKDVHHPDQY
jgi:hypothetical protein